MILKVQESVPDLKIGLYGTRVECFASVLRQHGIGYTLVQDISEVDETFDFVFESGVYSIIPETTLVKPKYGFIGTHETPLPEGRGHAPIQWTILNNRKNMVVTLYKLNKGVDSGQIICQQNVFFDRTDTLEILNSKREAGIVACFQTFIEELKEGVLVLRNQTGKGSYHKRRTAKDNELDVDKSLADLWDHIRICDNDKYPAWFRVGDKKVVLRYEVKGMRDK